MPESVKVYAETKSLISTYPIKKSIVKFLEFDFLKYGPRSQQITLTKLLKYL
jgi:hypothetical protein